MRLAGKAIHQITAMTVTEARDFFHTLTFHEDEQPVAQRLQQEIAARLYLSLRTIKFHTGNIYGKLGVDNRIRAVEEGRRMHIL